MLLQLKQVWLAKKNQSYSLNKEKLLFAIGDIAVSNLAKSDVCMARKGGFLKAQGI